MCPVCPNFSKQWGCLDIKTVMGNMVAAQGVREKTFFFSMGADNSSKDFLKSCNKR